MKKKRFTKKRIKALLHKVIPFILVGVITSSAVMMSYEKASEVKAVAVVDDVALMVALLAVAGIAIAGTALQNDSNEEDQEELAKRFSEEWDYDARLKAAQLGYIQMLTGVYNQILMSGGDPDGDPDNDNDNKNKFPTWKELKDRVASNGGDIALALGGATALHYLAGALGHSILKSAEEGAKKPYGLLEDYETHLQEMDSKLEDYCMQNKIDLLDYPYTFTFMRFSKTSSYFNVYTYYVKDKLSIILNQSDNSLSCSSRAEYVRVSSANYGCSVTRGDSDGRTESLNTDDFNISYYGNVPVCSSLEESLAFYDNPYLVYPDKYVNPSTIGQTSALKDMLKETDGKLEKGLYNAAILPTTEQLNKYFEDLKKALNEEEKQEVMDEFVRSLTDPVTDPNPNPNPDPDPNPNPNPDPDPNPNPNPDPNPNPNPDPDPNPNPNPNPNPDPDPDNPGDNTGDDTPKNESFLADLKHLFPFCIPFDLVDCFRLFNAEPVTPRVEVPVHFGIINYDHTFVFDLSDFNGVASVCRSMFLILYMVGLILATRALIKG